MSLIEETTECWYCKQSVKMVEKRDKVGHPYKECPRCKATDTDLPKEKKGK